MKVENTLSGNRELMVECVAGFRFYPRFLRLAVLLAVAGLAVWAGHPALGAEQDTGTRALSLAGVFGRGMVLQRHWPLTVWGTAEPGLEVRAFLAGEEGRGVADEEGRWSLLLPALPAGGPHALEVVAGDDRIALEDVLVGEVWLASGQSNMHMPVYQCLDADQELAQADFPRIRLLRVPFRVSETPAKELEADWRVCSSSTASNFSAAAFFFGRRIHQESGGLPVGLIDASWGGTPIAAWMPRKTLEEHPLFAHLLDHWREVMERYPDQQRIHEDLMAAWERERGAAAEFGGEPPPRPVAPIGPGHRFTPTGLYGGMIRPLAPFALRGVLWYQGERDAGRAYQYRELFPAMIHDWRELWGQGDLPFLFVQLANLGRPAEQPTRGGWAEQREAQAMALRLPRTAMAVTYDIGEADDIHPRNKQEVGRRLALAALATVYGQEREYSGPVYAGARIANGQIHIRFQHTDGGLVSGGEQLTGFAVAGSDRRLVWADARIEGDEVVVSSREVPEPVTVRYAWETNPQANLYNAAGLPAVPFRMDNWPLSSVNELRGN